LKFGGSRFRRASRPLDITRKIVAANARKQSKSPSEAREVDAFEFEEFNSATKFSA
jgi:hypothetical protein